MFTPFWIDNFANAIYVCLFRLFNFMILKIWRNVALICTKIEKLVKKLVECKLEEKKIILEFKKKNKKKLAEITSYQIHVLPYKNTSISGSYRFGYVFLISVRLTVLSCNFAVFTTK